MFQRVLLLVGVARSCVVSATPGTRVPRRDGGPSASFHSHPLKSPSSSLSSPAILVWYLIILIYMVIALTYSTWSL